VSSLPIKHDLGHNLLMYVSSEAVESAVGRADDKELARTMKPTVRSGIVFGSMAALLMYFIARTFLEDFFGLKDQAIE